MESTWIETAAKGRNGGPVRAGGWCTVVLGTHPIEEGQEVWLELTADDITLGPLPAYWTENRGVNSHWHVPIPPQAVGARLHYRSVARVQNGNLVYSPFQDTVVRANLPDRRETPEIVGVGHEGFVGNREMTVRVDGRGSTQDIYFPTVGLHSDVRPAEGDLPQSRAHFRAIIGGLAVRHRLDWFSERLAWQVFQHYQGATNLLVTELSWRSGPLRVLITDLVAMGSSLPKTVGGTESPGQYIKRFRIINDGATDLNTSFAVFIQSEVNGGIGEPGLSGTDEGRALLATNRGHGHTNRKLARDATVEFAVAFDDRGQTECEPTGSNEAILHRPLHVPAGQSIVVDLLVSGAFTGWRGDAGTFEHWLKPALEWFRSVDLDQVEQATAQEWDTYIEPIPNIHFPKPTYAVSLRRSALAAALHADAENGAIAAGFDRGLSAYCWPRNALSTASAFERINHADLSRAAFDWLGSVKGHKGSYAYLFQKYTIDGYPEWETPAVDPTAMVPWRMEQYYERTGDLDFVARHWPLIERSANVCMGVSGHPGLKLIEELSLISSAGVWDSRFGAFLYSNASVVAGLRAAARLAFAVNHDASASRWSDFADRIWHEGIMREPVDRSGPGMIDPDTGRFYEARYLSTLRGQWTDNPAFLLDRSAAYDISLLGLVVPFGLLDASQINIFRCAEGIFGHNVKPSEPNLLTIWSPDPKRQQNSVAPSEIHSLDVSSLATLWMSRYLVRLGRETGEGRHWNLAVAMLDAILNRIGSLGLALRSAPRSGELPRYSPLASNGVWELHASLIETMLDFPGLEYNAPARRLRLSPALPNSWPSIGLNQKFPCGDVAFRLDRPVGGSVHRLGVSAKLNCPVLLEVDVTCPGLTELGPWHGNIVGPPPQFQAGSGRVKWMVTLPEGTTQAEWAWG